MLAGRLLGTALLLGTVLTACAGPAAAPTPPQVRGDAERGRAVFTTGAQPACGTCHLVRDVSDGVIGPELTQIGTTAAERVKDPGYSGAAKDAVGYLRESITAPNAYIAPNCPAGACFRDVMPQDFAQKLTTQQLADLVAYLVTLQ